MKKDLLIHEVQSDIDSNAKGDDPTWLGLPRTWYGIWTTLRSPVQRGVNMPEKR